LTHLKKTRKKIRT